MDWQRKLITLYLFICNEYKTHLSSYCERMTNHADLSFSDEEVITIFLYGVIDKRRELKEIYNDASCHLKQWFPKLPELNSNVFADKAYQKENKPIFLDENATLHTPVKKIKRTKNSGLSRSITVERNFKHPPTD